MSTTTENNQAQGVNERKRAFYEEYSLVLGRMCLKLGLTPNFLTAVSFLCALAAGIAFWKAEMIWGVVFMFLTAFTDMLDGSTARAGNMGTVFGGILDHVSDRYGEFLILAGIVMSGTVHPGWGLTALFGMLIASYTRATAESMGKLENCAVGIMGRLEKFVLIMAGSVAEHFLPVGTWPRGGWLEFALIIVAVALIYSSKVLRPQPKKNKKKSASK